MRSPLFVIIAICWLGSAYSQRFVEPDKMKAFNITVNYPEYTVKTQMLKEPKKVKTDAALTYHWYTSQKIMETKGGFDGKLLHGTYRSFYLNDQLFESGEFEYGVKSGEWKNWYPDGKLKEITHWKKGRKNGSYVLYTADGLLMATGNFRNDLLSGNFTTYDRMGKVSSKTRYKKGKEVLKKEKVKKEKHRKKSSEPAESAGDKQSIRKEKKPWFGRKKSTAADPAAQDQNNTKSSKPEKESSSVKEKKKGDAAEAGHKRSFGEKLKSLFRKKPKAEKPAEKAAKKTSTTT